MAPGGVLLQEPHFLGIENWRKGRAAARHNTPKLPCGSCWYVYVRVFLLGYVFRRVHLCDVHISDTSIYQLAQ